MKEYSFNEFLTSKIDVDQKNLSELLSQCPRKEFQKGSFLNFSGDLCDTTFFVEKGLLRQYSIDNKGKEHILQFAPEGWWVTDRESTFFNKPSKYNVDALEDTTVFILKQELLDKLEKVIPNFTAFNNELLNNHIRHLQNRITLLLSATAEERYLTFTKMYPDILSRVPQLMVASYLGITPESLSRVRKELASKSSNSNS
ncbi:Crp/Fnr family transcriptional regulator [Brumimicrobium mesophilum]|uniref:Crp/Fnr family transcriptional regulator n=1 Tax=Brumimicrobium mesophilum TaxID=392717 RepID=UPI000D1406A5|nr:Crp/Fnr family transcriptional regulator [Brumimicrobium mesophilum]